MGSYEIILADDHRMMRQGVRRILEEQPGLKIIGEAGDGLELLALMKKNVPDLVIMDVSMPNLRGIEATREVKSQFPKVKVLILSMYKDKDYLAQAIAAGADGYILKEDADIELYSALKAIRTGSHYVSPTLADQVTDSFIKVLRKHPKQETQGRELTTRESEVLKLIAEGKTSREIADLLTISVRTAENHRLNLMRKLGFKKNIQLVRYAITKGYVSETG
jgi:DNA-binding NarL/FixJ family response regulator